MTLYKLLAANEQIGHMRLYKLQCCPSGKILVKGDYIYCQQILKRVMSPGDTYCEVSHAGRESRTLTYKEMYADWLEEEAFYAET